MLLLVSFCAKYSFITRTEFCIFLSSIRKFAKGITASQHPLRLQHNTPTQSSIFGEYLTNLNPAYDTAMPCRNLLVVSGLSAPGNRDRA